MKGTAGRWCSNDNPQGNTSPKTGSGTKREWDEETDGVYNAYRTSALTLE